MDRRRKGELFEEIRRDHAAGETIKKLAKKYGVHQRMVRQAVASAIPPERYIPNPALPLLFFDNPLSIGPNQNVSNATTQTLADSVSLQTNTQYMLIAEVDSESSGQNVVPEPSTVILLGTTVAGFLLRERLRRRLRFSSY